MSTGQTDNSDDFALAGEYVLGLLSGQTLKAFQKRLNTEPALRQLVADWEVDFAEILADTKPVGPPRHIKGDIDKRLFARPQTANANAGVSNLWRWLAGAGFATSLAIAALVILPEVSIAPDAPSLRAELAGDSNALFVTAEFYEQDSTLALVRLAGGAPPNRVLELWLIAEGADAPVSLGVLPADPNAVVTIPAALTATMATATLAISEEPIGGAPDGVPTGEILAIGSIEPA